MAPFFQLAVAVAFCVCAAAAPTPPPLECAYACPMANELHKQVLVTHPGAIPYTSPHSIFDCVYGVPRARSEPLKCSYYKENGLLALSAAGSPCPLQALPCAAIAPGGARYSAPEKIETPPWVDDVNHLFWVHSHL
ncbi:hypothetical protein BD779DRAFT_1673985 [Infundibulicybe gibba]|nr:hypothetical protein BD779DRAFT_1676291 [Infundibulicybe gibba]KAF8884594.1 hypothetical protein BD779DRAFT_1673985 [Infundibulicybe gibba]